MGKKENSLGELIFQLSDVAAGEPAKSDVHYRLIHRLCKNRPEVVFQTHRRGLGRPHEMSKLTFQHLHQLFQLECAVPPPRRDHPFLDEITRVMNLSPFEYVQGKGIVEKETK